MAGYGRQHPGDVRYCVEPPTAHIDYVDRLCIKREIAIDSGYRSHVAKITLDRYISQLDRFAPSSKVIHQLRYKVAIFLPDSGIVEGTRYNDVYLIRPVPCAQLHRIFANAVVIGRITCIRFINDARSRATINLCTACNDTSSTRVVTRDAVQ